MRGARALGRVASPTVQAELTERRMALAQAKVHYAQRLAQVGFRKAQAERKALQEARLAHETLLASLQRIEGSAGSRQPATLTALR